MQLQLTHSRTIHMAPRTATDKHTRAPVFKSYTKNSPQTQPSPTHIDTSRATVKRFKTGDAMSKYGNNDKACADEYKHDDVSQWTTSERQLNIHEA